MSVPRVPPEEPKPPPTSPTSAQQESKIAVQVPSGGSLLQQVQEKNKPRFSGVIILGFLEGLFTQRKIKREYIKKLEEDFTKKAEEQNISGASDIFKKFIGSQLGKKDLTSIQKFEEFIAHPSGVRYFMGTLGAYKSQPRTGIWSLHRAIDLAINTMEKNSSEVKRVLDALLKAQNVGMKAADQYFCADAIFSQLAKASQMNKSEAMRVQETAIQATKAIEQNPKEVKRLSEFLTKGKEATKHSERLGIINFMAALSSNFRDYKKQVDPFESVLDRLLAAPAFQTAIQTTPLTSVEKNGFLQFLLEPTCANFMHQALDAYGHDSEKLKEIIKFASQKSKLKNLGENMENLSEAFMLTQRGSPIFGLKSEKEIFDKNFEWIKSASVNEHDTFQNSVVEYKAKFLNSADKAEELSQFQSYLQNKTLENEADFFNFYSSPGGKSFLDQAIKLHGKNEIKMQEIVDNAIAVNKQGNTPYLMSAFQTVDLVMRLGDSFPEDDQFKYFETWTQIACKIPNMDFRLLLSDYKAYLNEIEFIQKQRPIVFDQESPERIKLVSDWSIITTKNQRASILNQFISNLRDRTVVDNKQVIQYSIQGLYRGPIQAGVRTVPSLAPRFLGSINNLYDQICIPFILPKDDSILENFSASTEIFITDPKTMETRAARLPLPISGRITAAEAQKQLEVLNKVVQDPKEFDNAYEKSGLNPEDKEILRAKFEDFEIKIGQELGKTLQDFNATALRPKFSNILEDPLMADLLSNPDSQAKAIQAAKLRNIFVLGDNTLSLLPSGPGEKHKEVGTLSEVEKENAQKALLENKIEAISISIPESMSDDASVKKADLKITFQETYVSETIRYLVMRATISMDGKSTSRETYYDPGDMSDEEVMKRVITTREFERDLLLAKATFMDEHIH